MLFSQVSHHKYPLLRSKTRSILNLTQATVSSTSIRSRRTCKITINKIAISVSVNRFPYRDIEPL